jgi:recombinational DNA repair protein RecR
MKKKLKPLNSKIQVCPDCGKVDAHKNDGHICDRDFREENQIYGRNAQD